MTSGNTDSARAFHIEQLKNDLRRRVRRSYILSFVYLVVTFALICVAYLVYDGTVGRAVKDVSQITGLEDSRVSRVFDFDDVATNPVDGTVVAVGTDSSILVFSDDGKIRHEFKRAGGTQSDLRSIAFSGNGKTAIAAGDNGLILVSTDHGESWSSAESGTDKDFIRVALSKDRIAIAVGDRGLIRVSRDRGKTWSRPDPSNITSKHINDIVLSNNGKTSVAVADDEVTLFSRDEGKTWVAQINGDGKHDVEAVAVHDTDKTAVAVGDNGSILSSCNKGESWERLKDIGKKDDFSDIAISGDGRIAIAVGRRGVIWTLTGANLCQGRTWMKRDSKVGEHLEAVALNQDGSIAVAVGRDGTILVSEDKGETWTSRDSRTASDLYRVTLDFDGRSAVAVGENSTILWLVSSDGTLVLDKVNSKVNSLGTDRTEDGGDNFQKLANQYTLFERTGIVLLLVFLIQYLMSLTRYNLRLAAFYNARRDAIRLTTVEALPQLGNVDELEQMVHALSPDGVDFGRSPKSVIDLAIQLARPAKRYWKNSATRE